MVLVMGLATSANWSFKFITALLLGMTMAMIGQEIVKYEFIAFLFVMFLTAGIVLRLLKSFSIVNVIVFNLICVLVGMALRLYIQIAP